ncbi:MAG: hypothetical protein CMD66_09620 [Gammaproteobacteria bacterium]|nr:hypothetical protein [Gammaproteobacteria bacterium]
MRTALVVLLFASSTWADEVMICGNNIYRLDQNLLVADKIFERKDGNAKIICGRKWRERSGLQ